MGSSCPPRTQATTPGLRRPDCALPARPAAAHGGLVGSWRTGESGAPRRSDTKSGKKNGESAPTEPTAEAVNPVGDTFTMPDDGLPEPSADSCYLLDRICDADLDIVPVSFADTTADASLSVFPDRCAYRMVTLGSECPRIVCTSNKVRPPARSRLA